MHTLHGCSGMAWARRHAPYWHGTARKILARDGFGTARHGKSWHGTDLARIGTEWYGKCQESKMSSTEPHTDLKTCKIRCPIGRVTRQIYEIGRPIGRSGVRRCNWSKHPNTHANICQSYRRQRGAADGGRGPPLMSISLAYVGMCIRMLRPIASSDT